MHEFFITAVVEDKDVVCARSVLRGVSECAERHLFYRVVYYTSPVGGLAQVRSLIKGPNGKLWAELHGILAKQSYIVQVRYPVEPQALRNKQEKDSLAGRTGVLVFNDLPEPNRDAIHVLRKILDIEQPDLERILRENKFTRETEMLEESYSWPVEADYTAYLTAQRQHPRDRVSQSRPASLPRDPPPQDPSEEESESAYPDLSEFAVFYPWLLNMRTYSDGATPEEIQHAFGLLNMARETFRGVFDFRHFDRLVHDTRNIDRGNPPPAPVQARA